MRRFVTRSRILKEQLLYCPKNGPFLCQVRTRDESYIGGSAQIIDFSKNGGLTWVRVANFTPVVNQDPLIAWDGVNTFVIICGTTVTTQDGLFKSTDGGDSFARVSGITGFTFATETATSIQYAQGAGSSLWMCGLDSLGDQFLRESTDDGSSWTDRTATGVTDSVICMAHNATGMVVAETGGNNTDGLFDADGVSIPAAFTTNLFGMGVNWIGYATGGFQGQFLFGNANWGHPGRFWAVFHENGVAIGGRNQFILFSDNGTDWEQVAFNFNFPNMDDISDRINFGWDGQRYHCIFDGTLGSGQGPDNFWLQSKDGIVWTKSADLPNDFFNGNFHTRSAFVQNT